MEDTGEDWKDDDWNVQEVHGYYHHHHHHQAPQVPEPVATFGLGIAR